MILFSKTISAFNSIFKTDTGELNILGKIGKLIIIYLIISALKKLVNKFIKNSFKRRKEIFPQIDNKRSETLINILNKIIGVLLTTTGVLMGLEVFGIDTKTLIGAMGVGGIAVGFGAQSLVKDVITGFFILLEDQFSVGDHVELEGKEGIVEDLGLRVTKIRDFGGELYIIPNSSINIVTNKSRGAMRASVLVSIAYEEDLDRAIEVLEEMCQDIWKEEDHIVELPEVKGVAETSDYSVDIMIHAKTKALEQWGIERLIRKKALDYLNRENIEIPYPKTIVYKGDE